MIVLLGKPGDSCGKIRFTPRDGFKRKHPTLEKELVYGFTCPHCANVILSLFRTETPVDLWPYEQTDVISIGEKTAGEVNRTLPNVDSKFGFSCYGSEPMRRFGADKHTEGQRIHLKKHLLLNEPILAPHATEGIFEVGGEHCCEYTGWFGLREDLLLKDVALANAVAPHELVNWDFTKHTVSSFVASANNSSFRLLSGIGKVPPIVLVSRASFAMGRKSYEVRSIMESCQIIKESA
jgi:hypothetical protein